MTLAKTATRPPVASLLPTTNVNDDTRLITAGNPDLLPYTADNFEVAVQRYFEPVGLLEASAFLKEISNYTRSFDTVVAAGADNGFEGQFEGYKILQSLNAGIAIAQGWEFAYQQQFRFLPGLLRTLRFNANYTLINAHGDFGTTGLYLKNYQINSFIPRTVNASFSWDYRKFGVSMTYNYTSSSIRNAYNVTAPSRNQYMMARELVNLNLRYQLPRSMTLTVGVANLFNEPQIYYRGVADQLETFLVQGTTITAGLEARF